MYSIIYTKQAYKDAIKVAKSNLESKVSALLDIIEENPWESYPSYEKLQFAEGNIYSRRINVQHRLVYQVLEEEKTIKILRMWSHYGDN